LLRSVLEGQSISNQGAVTALPAVAGRSERVAEEVLRDEELDRRSAVSAGLEYVKKLSPGVGRFANAVTRATLAFSDFLADERILGFDVIRAEKGGPDSKPWWVIGRLKESQIKYLEEFGYYGSRRVMALGENQRMCLGRSAAENLGERPTNLYVKQALKSAVDVVKKKYSDWQYIPYPNPNKAFEPGRYPVRKVPQEEALVRLVHKNGFVDVPIKDVEGLLKDVQLKNNSVNWTCLEEFLVEGSTRLITSPPYKTHAMSEWDITSSLLKEPPLMALSIGNDTTESHTEWRLKDPHILAHINVGVNNKGRLESINCEFSHALNGIPGVQELYAGIVEDLFKYESEKPSQFALEVSRMNADKPEKEELEKVEGKPVVHMEVEHFDPEKNEDLERESFSDDPLMYDFAKSVDILQVNCEVEMPSRIAEYIRKSSKFFGGNIVISTLAGLLVSGQATMFTADSKKNGLQVGLGLGGTAFHINLRRAISIFAEGKKNLDRFNSDEIINVKEFMSIGGLEGGVS